jgi:hypothetical protein
LAEDGVPAASASAAVEVVLVVLLVVDWVGAPGRALVGAAWVAGAVAAGAVGVMDWAGAVVVVVVEEVVAGGVWAGAVDWAKAAPASETVAAAANMAILVFICSAPS